jgi:cytochrome c-type biogenesis protein CcmH
MKVRAMRSIARVCGRAILAVALSMLLGGGAAAQPVDQAFEARIKNLETGLRCLVCQNQTLADSNASLADDLRREVRGLALAGKSDDEIKSYLVARYGDFVLYKPPLQSNTLLLWFAPFALLACGALLWWTLLRQRQRRQTDVEPGVAGVEATGDQPESVEQAQARGRALLDESRPV